MVIGGAVTSGTGFIEAVHVDGSPQLHRLNGTAAWWFMVISAFFSMY